jgi:hypothetical protein
VGAARLNGTSRARSGAEEFDILGTVLHASGAPAPVRLPTGATLVTTLTDSRTVLTNPSEFRLPQDVSRERLDTSTPEGPRTTPLPASAVDLGRRVFVEELADAARHVVDPEVDTLRFMRLPVARSTTAALLPGADLDTRNHVAGLVLDWVDSLGPIISAARSPRRWSRPRRAERASRTALADALAGLTADPSALAPALAAGVQVPVAAGAWCLTQLASRTDLQHAIRADSGLALPFVWEILRLWPPSWLLPRITSRECLVGETRLPADAAVLVSPFALGRLPDLVPGPVDGHAPVDQIDPTRWADGGTRPGSWLPFGAGPHACPGRNLALAQLVHLVSWATAYDLVSPAAPGVNTDRGLSPDPSHIRISRRQPGDLPRA